MRQSVTIDEIKDRLLAQLDQVLDRYAPPAPGSYRKGGRYFTLNPGRADRRVGSFCVTLSGPDAGRWIDFATHPRGGDVLDLIGLALNLSPVDTIREARAFLGLDTESPEVKRARERAAEAAKERRAAEALAEKARAVRRRKAAQALWLSAQERIAGTPVDAYLRGRGIDLSALGWQPRAIRYHPECLYLREEEVVDPETGEITTRAAPPLKLPAMVTAITRGSEHVGTHRTYLGIDPATGRWAKAPVPDAKKVLGEMMGGSIRLGNGTGPRGGRGAPLSACPPGTRVHVAEGIETALSVLMLRPGLRMLAAVSLGNMGEIDLPDTVTEVVLIPDGDEGAQAQAAFARAVERHAARGREVRVLPPVAGQDFNDRLQAALAAEAMGQEGAA